MSKYGDSVINNIAYSRSIRYFGRGFGELMLPIFIFSFFSNYTETGFLIALYDITSLMVLPVIGHFADKFGGKKLLILSLLLYPIIGISYFLSGMLHLSIFIVIARIINGITRSLYTIGEKIYIRKFAHESKVGTSMGYVATIGEILRTIGSLLGALILYKTALPMYYLFLTIIPTAWYALLYINKLPHIDKSESSGFKLDYKGIRDIYIDLKTVLGTFTGGLKIYTILYFLLNFIESAIGLIIPIYFYIETQSIFLVVLTGLVINMPTLFSYGLGKLADKYKSLGLMIGFLTIAIFSIFFIVSTLYSLKILILLILSFAFVFLSLAVDGLSNRFIQHDMYGRSESIFELIRSLGSILGLVLGGMYIDMFGIDNLFILTSMIALSILCYVYGKSSQLR